MEHVPNTITDAYLNSVTFNATREEIALLIRLD